jgi:hypothetical protein
MQTPDMLGELEAVRWWHILISLGSGSHDPLVALGLMQALALSPLSVLPHRPLQLPQMASDASLAFAYAVSPCPHIPTRYVAPLSSDTLIPDLLGFSSETTHCLLGLVWTQG